MTEDNRIGQIRAVLEYVDQHEQPSPYVALRRIRAILDSAPTAPEPWQVEAHIQEQRATSLGYCEHVVETYPDGEEETCSNLRRRGEVTCDEHASAPRASSTPLPFDLWWSPSMRQLLARHENSNDEHLVWIVQMTTESLRQHLGTGPESNPPMPDDAVQIVPDRSITTQGVHVIDRVRAVLRDPMLDEAMMLDQVNTILDETPPRTGRGAKVNRNDEAGLPYYGT